MRDEVVINHPLGAIFLCPIGSKANGAAEMHPGIGPDLMLDPFLA
jgi:hypothetical protein